MPKLENSGSFIIKLKSMIYKDFIDRKTSFSIQSMVSECLKDCDDKYE